MRVGAESSNRGGFTLIEALVAMVLSTVVLMLVTSVFLVQNYFYPRPSRAIQKVVEAVGVPWSVLSDREFPVDYEGTLPNFGSLDPGSFPVIRVTGDFFPSAAESGRGVLIVTGDLGIPANSGWQWKGIVMTGGLRDFGPESNFLLEGMLVAGQGSPMNNWDMDNGRILYHSCYVSWAGASLAHLSAVYGGWWEKR